VQGIAGKFTAQGEFFALCEGFRDNRGHFTVSYTTTPKEASVEKLRKILAPTDLSELSLAGVNYALELAHSQDAEVILYHVIGITENWVSGRDEFDPVRGLIEDHKSLLDRFVKEKLSDLSGKVKVRQLVEIGVPYKSIVEKAEEEGVDMIIMSTHGRSGFDHMLIGGVTEKVVRRANCPVLSIRPTGVHKANPQTA
jgi:nucleotide-binding universal stress UspA family protein